MSDSYFEKTKEINSWKEKNQIKLFDNRDGTYSFSISPSSSGEQKPLFFKRLSNGSTENMALDGSVTPEIFYIQPPEGEVWRISSWHLYIEDNGALDASKWGNNITLANGFMPRLKIGETITDMIGFGLKTNADLASVAKKFKLLDFGSGSNIAVAIWDFTETGQFIRLTDADQLQLVVNDNLTDLVAQYTHIHGYIE